MTYQLDKNLEPGPLPYMQMIKFTFLRVPTNNCNFRFDIELFERELEISLGYLRA